MRIVRRGMLVLLALVLCSAVAVVVQLHRDGYRAYIIHTGSMTGTYDVGGLVIDRPVTSPLQVGQTITFLHSGLSSDVVTHRIVGLKNGTIQTKGDANSVADTWNIRPDQVKGKVVRYVPDLGYLVIFLKQPAGVGAAMSALLAVVFLWGLFFPAVATSAEAKASSAARGKHARPKRHSLVIAPAQIERADPADQHGRRHRQRATSTSDPIARLRRGPRPATIDDNALDVLRLGNALVLTAS